MRNQAYIFNSPDKQTWEQTVKKDGSVSWWV